MDVKACLASDQRAFLFAHQHPSQWFFTAGPSASVTDFDLLRFQGDALYLRKEYGPALELSKKALALVAAYEGTAPQTQRVKEWTDMAARCALHLGDLEQAEHYAVERVSWAVSACGFGALTGANADENGPRGGHSWQAPRGRCAGRAGPLRRCM